jgi:KaiC/GvpD/RAD55 family RecA-like ATPase
MSVKEQLPSIIEAVQEELGKGSKKRSVVLFDGKLLSTEAENSVYRFEIPEGVFFGHVDDADIIYQDTVIEGEILSVDNQFVTLSIAENLGDRVGQIAVEWATKLILERLLARLIKISGAGDKVDFTIPSSLFNPDGNAAGTINLNEVRADERRNDPQRKAIAGAIANRVTFVWGPPGTGKTSTLGFIAYNLIKKGQRVLFATNTNRAVDVALQNVIGAYRHFDEPFAGAITRYGKPFIQSDADLQAICFQNELQKIKEELKEEIRDEYQLLLEFRTVKREVSEHISYLQQKSTAEKALRKSDTTLQRLQEDLNKLKQQLAGRKGAGFLSRLVSEFIGTSVQTVEQQIESKKRSIDQAEEKRSMTARKLKELEAGCPIEPETLDEYTKLKTAVDNHGGEDKLTAFVKEKLEVDEAPLLRKKMMLGATLAKVITNDVFFKLDFDALIIDEASMVSLPYLVVLSTQVKKRVVIVGDPQQLPPIAHSQSPWFQKDIYMHASGCASVQDLFEWHARCPEFTYFLDSQYRMTGALGDIISKQFYQGKLLNGVPDQPDAEAGIVFVNTSPLRPHIQKLPGESGFAPYNAIHTERIIAILKSIAMTGEFRPEDIGIVVPFKASVQYVRHQLRQAGLSAVEVGTVHTYQGREKDFVIFDTVMSFDRDSNAAYSVRMFDQVKTSEDEVRRLLNVALSRCRRVLFLIADVTHFEQQYPGQFITRLLTSLQDNANVVSNVDGAAADFDDLPAEAQAEKVGNVVAEEESGTGVGRVAEGTRKTVRKYGNEIDALRFDINSLAVTKRNRPIFRPGRKVADFMEKIPTYVVTNEESFERWIKNMQMFFYESCGGPNASSPVVNPRNETFKIRWQINKLRVGFAHDMAQFSDEEKHKIHGVYDELIGVKYPAEDEEWTKMQFAIMARTIEWLELVKQCLENQ